MLEPLESRRLLAAVSLAGAANAGTLTGRSSFNDSLTATNLADVRKFTLSAAATFSAAISGLSQNADLQLIKDTNNNLLVDAGETLATSAHSGTAVESISKSLAAGTYYVRVFKTVAASTNYTLTLKSDSAGNALTTSRNVGTISTAALAFKDFVGKDDAADFYKFTLAGAKPFTATLSGLSADANLQIIRDANNNGVIDTGDTIGASAKAGSASDTITKTLPAGTYFARVFANGVAETNYTLSLSPIGHLKIVFDYTYDKSGFFAAHPAAKDRLNDAAATFAILGDNLAAITPSGGNTWQAVIDSPGEAGGPEVDINNLKVPANTLIIYVGGRTDLGGSELGHGGPGGWGASGSQSWLDAIQKRGQAGAGSANPTDVAPWGGSITFLSTANWNFNATNPTSSQNDFLSVATHELGHVFGIGTSDPWVNKSVGGFFTGANAKAANNNANVPLDGGGGHWKQGLISSVDGKSQEVVMDPSLLRGTRRRFTRIDYAALADIGWQVPATAAVATPAAAPSFNFSTVAIVSASPHHQKDLDAVGLA